MTIKFKTEELEVINYIKNSSFYSACLSADSASRYLKEEDLKKISSLNWKPIRWKNDSVKLYKLLNLVSYVFEKNADLKDFENDGQDFLDDSYKEKLEFAFSCFVLIKNLRDKEYLEQEVKQLQSKQQTKLLKF